MLKKKIALGVLLIIAVIGGPIALYKGIEIAELREVQVRVLRITKKLSSFTGLRGISQVKADIMENMQKK